MYPASNQYILNSLQEKPMIEAVLFDIDNTLILFDENAFFKAYMTRLTPKFLDIFTADTFQKRLIGATRALLDNQGLISNADYYLNHFSRDMENLKPEFWSRFEDFYATEFDQLGTMVETIKGTHDLLKTISERGIKLVAASNPLWPLSVQMIRLAWAGVDTLPYSWITHIENSVYCKPQPKYFREICQKIGLQPEHCLMVGNDPLNDMIAGETGMKTYMTTDSQIQGYTSFSLSAQIRSNSSQPLPVPDFEGPLAGVIDVI